MGTRSRIGFTGTDGKITSTYCHWDGYVKGVGLTLHEHYNTHRAASSVARLGYISALRNNLDATRIDAANEEKPVKTKTVGGFLRLADDCTAEYAYLWKEGRWLVAVIDGTCDEDWQELGAALEAEGVFV